MLETNIDNSQELQLLALNKIERIIPLVHNGVKKEILELKEIIFKMKVVDDLPYIVN